MFVCLPPRVDDDGAWVRILSELFILFNQLVETALVGFGRVNVFVWAWDSFTARTLWQKLATLCQIYSLVCMYIHICIIVTALNGINERMDRWGLLATVLPSNNGELPLREQYQIQWGITCTAHSNQQNFTHRYRGSRRRQYLFFK